MDRETRPTCDAVPCADCSALLCTAEFDDVAAYDHDPKAIRAHEAIVPTGPCVALCMVPPPLAEALARVSA